MAPGPTKSSIREGDKNTHREHERVSLSFCRRDLDECADASIRGLDEVAVDISKGRIGGEGTNTRSSSRLCRPEGRDLNSTPSSETERQLALRIPRVEAPTTVSGLPPANSVSRAPVS